MFGQSLTAIGLIVEAFGVLMIFFFGPPQPNFEWEENEMYVVSPRKPGRKRSRYKVISLVALAFIFAGLILQLYDAWKW
jgi:hypothetical protein